MQRLQCFLILLLCTNLLKLCSADRTSCDGQKRDCSAGKQFCNCPGDGVEVFFHLECYRAAWWQCSAPLDGHCGRYSLCRTCHTGISQDNMEACSSCLNIGYTGGQCHTDVDECQNNNAGCAQICLNTMGSYQCDCRPGYALDVNKHTCTRRRCERPVLEDMTMLSTPYPDWQFETYVEYSCTRLHHVIVGRKSRQCLATSDHQMYWDGEPPSCVAVCDAQEEHVLCGVTGVAPKACDQLGCCDIPEQGTCHMKPGHIYISYTGGRPLPSTGVAERVADGADQCRDFCEGSPVCHSFALYQEPNSHTCFLYEKDREYYVNEGTMGTDENSTYYNPLFFEDDIDWRKERSFMHQSLHYGCFNIPTTKKYLPVQTLANKKLLTAMLCVDTCRTHGYSFAGVRVDECRCGKEVPRVISEYEDFNTTEKCVYNCSGDADQICGGDNYYTVLVVPRDERYIGCYDAMTNYLPIKLWTYNTNKTVEDCIQSCAGDVFGYAGIQHGGDCYCGKQFGIAYAVSSQHCNVSCSSQHDRQQCGGEGYNSIYRTTASYDLTKPRFSHFTPTLYSKLDNLTTIETYKLTMFPHLQNIITKRIVLSSSVPFKTPYEDMFASTGENIAPCGSLRSNNEVYPGQENITIRAFFIKFTEVSSILASANAKHVTVYAQTFVVDASIDIDYTFIVKAHVIFLDREKATMIRFSKASQEIPFEEDEWQEVIRQGPYPDVYFQRLSYTCAKMLLSTKKQAYINAGYAVLRDIANSPAKDEEQKAIRNSAKALHAKLSGVDYSNTHHVPLYTKEHMVRILETYFTQISIYKEDYDRLQDATLLFENFLSVASEMNSIHKDTIVNEALVSFQNLEQNFKTDIKTQEATKIAFRNTEANFTNATGAVMDELDEMEEDAKKRARWGFFAAMISVTAGLFSNDYEAVGEGLQFAFGAGAQLESTMRNLAKINNLINKITATAQNILADAENIITLNEDSVIIDIEALVSMKVSVTEWKAIRDSSEIVLEGLELESVTNYRVALSDYTIWGEALSLSMIATAETLRQLMEKKAILDLRREQQEKTVKLLGDATSNVESKRQILHIMEEQALDVSIDLNEALVQFCEAYFYENLEECSEAYRPSFGSSLRNILLKINAAKRDGLYIADVYSSVSRSVTFLDVPLEDSNDLLTTAAANESGLITEATTTAKNTGNGNGNNHGNGKAANNNNGHNHGNGKAANNNNGHGNENSGPGNNNGNGNGIRAQCNNQLICPITYFKNHKTLILTLKPNHENFYDLHKYRIREIFIELEGLNTDQKNAHEIKFFLSNSGLFQDQRRKVYDFMTRPVKLAFAEELDAAGHQTIRADFPEEVHHITPFTTWIITLSHKHDEEVDLSGITAMRIRFDGTAVIIPDE